MSLIASVKVLGDLCFYFSVISVLPILFSGKILWLWPGLICAGGAAVAVSLHEWAMVHRKNTKWRYLAAVCPLSMLFMAGSSMDLMILTPAAVYTVLVIHKGIYTLEYFPYRSQFQYSMILWAIVFGLCFLLENLSRPFDGQIRFHYESMLAYGMGYCVCAVFLLRHLRMGLHGSWRRSVHNGCELAVIGVIAGFFSLAAIGYWEIYRFFRGPVNRFFSWILSIFMLIPAMLEQSLSQGIRNMDFEAMYKAIIENEEYSEEILGQPLVEEAPLWEEVRNNPLVQPAESIPWWVVILIVLVLSFVLWKMISVYMRTNPAPVRVGIHGKTWVREIQEPEDRRSPREKVRRCYRDFLKLMAGKGFKREEYHTSEDILAAAGTMVSPQAAVALRQVYIAARYDEAGVVTEEQVRKARKALKKLKEHRGSESAQGNRKRISEWMERK